MDNKKRDEFWQLLCGFNGINIDEELRQVHNTLEYPKLLYKYLPISEYALDNLRTNTLYFSSADKFDDPFDTYIHVDSKEVERQVKEFFKNTQAIDTFKELYKELYGQSFSQNADKINELFNSKFVMNVFNAVSKNTRSFIQQSICAACFSEEEHNRALWLKYGQNHQGFCLIYDTTNSTNYLCGKEEKCNNCKSNIPTPLYPIYYSKDKLDASQHIEHIIGLTLLEQLPNTDSELFNRFSDMIRITYGNDVWWNVRVSIIKEYSHNQDKEWRMLINNPYKNGFIKKWRPSGIILGLKTSETNKSILISLAREAGIEHIYQTVIDDNDELKSVEIK